MSKTVGIRILTWNLNGLDSTRLDTRVEAMCVELVLGVKLRDALAGAESPPLPHVLCLQEVVRRAHVGKLRGHLGAAGFELFPKTPPDREEYTVIAARPPWRLHHAEVTPFEESPLGRTFVEATLEHESGAQRRVLTAHMESLRSGREARIAQALELDERMHRDATPSVFAGDTNLRESEHRAARAAGMRALDVFELAGAPPEHRDTWPTYDDEHPRGYRFDRIWVDAAESWTVEALRTRRRPKLSDHAALEARLLS